VRGELRLVVDRLAREVWIPVIEEHPERDQVAGGVFASLIRHMHDRYTPDPGDGLPDKPLELRAADCATDHELAISELEAISSDDFESEAKAVRTVPSVLELLEEYDSQESLGQYTERLSEFMARYSLRYYVGNGGNLRGTLPGIATSTYFELRKICILSDALRVQLDDFEHALAEAIDEPSETRVKTALARLFILMEGVAVGHPDAAGSGANTFGEICQRLRSWPHSAVQEAAESLYRFASDYPGIRHAGNQSSMKRPVEPSDLAAICTIMFGFTSYLNPDIPDAAGLKLERWIRQSAEAQALAPKTW
jgi:hypothetical protein